MDRTLPHYDLVVIGSGSGNSLLDERFNDLKVALVDKGIDNGTQDLGPTDPGVFGGTCLNVGCIPTKMLVYPADLAIAGQEGAKLGIDLPRGKGDWPAIRDRIFGRIDAIADGGLDWREQNPNITVYRGEARFTGPKTLGVAGGKITADRFVIATGSRPRALSVRGADDPRVHTSDTIMRIDRLPETLVIIGGGYISAEFAHVFTALGVRVAIISHSGAMLRREDADVSARFTQLMSQRATVRLNQTLMRFESLDDRIVTVTTDSNGVEYEYESDLVLNATGRIPNSDRMNLRAAGIETDEQGMIVVDEYQRTNIDGIFAMGDISSPFQLKHVANHETRVVQHNLLNPKSPIASDHRFVPHAVFSHPQVASVGLTEKQAHDRDLTFVTATQEYGSVAYGWAMEDTEHFCKLVADPKTGLLLGAHIIGPQASILIQPLIQAMSFGLGVREMARGQYWIHPALTEVVENALLALPLD